MSRWVDMEELREGDTIAVWWSPRRDTITGLRPYRGPLACIRGAKIAKFALWTLGMTLEPGGRYELLNRPGEKNKE